MIGVWVISFDQVVVFLFCFFCFLELAFSAPLPAFELLPLTEMHTSQYT